MTVEAGADQIGPAAEAARSYFGSIARQDLDAALACWKAEASTIWRPWVSCRRRRACATTSRRCSPPFRTSVTRCWHWSPTGSRRRFAGGQPVLHQRASHGSPGQRGDAGGGRVRPAAGGRGRAHRPQRLILGRRRGRALHRPAAAARWRLGADAHGTVQPQDAAHWAPRPAGLREHSRGGGPLAARRRCDPVA